MRRSLPLPADTQGDDRMTTARPIRERMALSTGMG
jgi:hypothetical protein